VCGGPRGRSLGGPAVTTRRQLKPGYGWGQAELFAPATVTRWQLDFTREGMFRTGTRHFVGQNPPRQATFDFFLPKKAEKLSLKILDLHGNLVRELDVSKEKEAGLHRVSWDLISGKEPPEAKGKTP